MMRPIILIVAILAHFGSNLGRHCKFDHSTHYLILVVVVTDREVLRSRRRSSSGGGGGGGTKSSSTENSNDVHNFRLEGAVGLLPSRLSDV